METKRLFKPFLKEYFLDVTYGLIPLTIYHMVHASLGSNNSNFSFFCGYLLFKIFSITTCFYITWQLFQISCQDPAYLVLVHHGDRQASI